jgi:hypothetical protein
MFLRIGLSICFILLAVFSTSAQTGNLPSLDSLKQAVIELEQDRVRGQLEPSPISAAIENRNIGGHYWLYDYNNWRTALGQ